MGERGQFMDLSDGQDMDVEEHMTFTPGLPAEQDLMPMPDMDDMPQDRLGMLAKAGAMAGTSRRGGPKHSMDAISEENKVKLAHAKFYNKFDDDLDESDMALQQPATDSAAASAPAAAPVPSTAAKPAAAGQ